MVQGKFKKIKECTHCGDRQPTGGGGFMCPRKPTNKNTSFENVPVNW